MKSWSSLSFRTRVGQRHAQAEDLGIVEVEREARDVDHPGVRVALVEQVIAPGGHHADAAGAADAVVEAGEVDGAQAAAGEAGAADARRVDVGRASRGSRAHAGPRP